MKPTVEQYVVTLLQKLEEDVRLAGKQEFWENIWSCLSMLPLDMQGKQIKIFLKCS